MLFLFVARWFPLKHWHCALIVLFTLRPVTDVVIIVDVVFVVHVHYVNFYTTLRLLGTRKLLAEPL